MLKKDIIRRNPLKLMGYEEEDILGRGEFGALTARAGVGKTSFLVQLALDKMLRGRNVLHISIDEPVEKVCLCYEEVFRNITNQYGTHQAVQFWDTVLPNRFIMTFKVDGFSAPRLEERINDLTEQGIFFPQLLIIDGLPFEKTDRQIIESLKALADEQGLAVWFTVRTHRHELPGPDGIPVQLEAVKDLFKVALELQPEGKDIYVKALKGGPSGNGNSGLILDPATMMVRSKEAPCAC